MKRTFGLVGGLLGAALIAPAFAAQIALYPTGPSQDSAYLRFVNVSASPLELTPDGARTSLKLEGDKVVSDFIPVPGGQAIKGTLSRDGHKAALEAKVAAGDFATVFALDDGHQGIRQLVVNEAFDIPNQLKASLALFDAESGCAEAKVNLAGRDVDLFQKAPAGNPRRQELNPRGSLAVQLICAGKPVGAAVELGALEANKRYSLLILPSSTGPRLITATDSVSN
ncbi:Alginate O-acetyl transferase AlgF [Pseudomonas asplenii]|uniref:Alginate O-acetyl transferase AlgF n=1 Tax=Pseudomonas asplenii TaxID=53407 RepID=A0A0N0E5Z6_9PSED|nr:cell division protein FtsQ [Pseudomonas fuscovaginae]KPA92996.1 Alginate O-acetyl transferase AlgF [Pseudomonas fuscovaginae]